MRAARAKTPDKEKRSSAPAVRAPLTRPPQAARHAALLDEARAAGLLAGDKSAHVSFRATPALLEAAKREAGVSSTTELGLLALVLLAQPDPVVRAMRQTRGRLGSDHQLAD